VLTFVDVDASTSTNSACAEILCTAADWKAADSTRLTSRRFAAVTKR
jgi:hypothetical protein